MNKISRRTAMSTLIPGSLLLVALPTRAAADQPRMQAALEALRTAKRELQAATPDKGGYRMKAISHVNRAIAEVERGIRFDRRH